MNDSRRRDFLKVAGGVAVVGSLAGCAGEAQEEDPGNETGGQEPGTDQPEEEPPAEDEPMDEEQQEGDQQEATGDDLIRVAHMIPDFAAVDVYVDGSEEPVFSGLSYTDTTDYVELGAGDHQIRVTAAGAQSLVVFDQQVSIPSGNTTAVALGSGGGGGNGQGGNATAQQGGSDLGFQLELFPDQNTAPEGSINNSRLRLIHASPDAPAVDVLAGQTPVFENISYGMAEYFDLPAGEYEFSIFPADSGAGGGAGTEGGNETDGGNGGLFSSLAATDGGSEIGLLQDDGNETVPEEDEAEEEDSAGEPVYSFDVTTEENAVYTAFATGYLDPEAANSEEEFQVVIAQDVLDGEVIEADDE